MHSVNHPLSRRQLLAAGLGVSATAILMSAWPGTALAAPAAPTRQWNGSRSANGWPVLSTAPSVVIEGSDVAVALAAGDAAVILGHVARRFHYEIDALRSGDLSGFTTDRTIHEDYESNYLPGSALAVRAGSYPVGAHDGLYPQELAVVRDILAECQDVVRWGGDEPVPKESHFQIDRPPQARAVRSLADTIRSWTATPGEGAGAVDAFDPERIAQAREFADQQAD